MPLTFKTSSKSLTANSRLYSLFHAVKRSPIALVIGGCVALDGTCEARADWPEFRGPNQNGTVTTAKAPMEWSEEKNVVWYTPTQGLGWSSPVVIGDRIYVTSARNTASGDSALAGPQTLHLECYSARTGKPLFDRMLIEQDQDAPSIHKKNSHASPTVLANAGKLYVHFGHQGTVCTDLDGNILWRNQDHTYSPVHGNGGSPIVLDNKLFLTCDGGDTAYTLALDAATGSEVWRTPRGIATDRPFSFCTPQAIQVEGKWQIVSPGSNLAQSLDPDTGNVIWSVSYEGFSVVPRPLFYRGLVFVCTGYMTPKLLAIDPTGSGDVTETHVRWTYGTGVPNTPSIVPVADQIVMVSDGGVSSGVDIETGKKVWQKRLGGNYSASLMAIGNRVYFQSEGGEAIVMEIGAEPKELSRAMLPGRIFASYAWLEGDWIIRAENGLYRIGER
ncbi:MAG: PQQ-binding-like beta-propeller repeat protein [Planctomycetota bacterium]